MRSYGNHSRRLERLVRSECFPVRTVSLLEFLVLLDTFKIASGSDNVNATLLMGEIQNMNVDTINFVRITKISSFG